MNDLDGHLIEFLNPVHVVLSALLVFLTALFARGSNARPVSCCCGNAVDVHFDACTLFVTHSIAGPTHPARPHPILASA